MKRKFSNLSRRYQVALRTHLKQGQKANLEPARGLGSQALAAGLKSLDLARLHEQTIVTEVLPGCPAGKRAALIKQAGIFFVAGITPIGKTHRTGHRHHHQGADSVSQDRCAGGPKNPLMKFARSTLITV